jgi:hypothetical protein
MVFKIRKILGCLRKQPALEIDCKKCESGKFAKYQAGFFGVGVWEFV